MWSIFSPDDRQIAFLWAGASEQEIRLVNLDGSSARTIWRQPKDDWMTLNDWSPDRRHLLIVQTHSGTNSKILLMSVMDGKITQLKAQPTDTGRMAFSRNGKWIAHNGPQVYGGPGSDIYLLSRDGTRDSSMRLSTRSTAFC
jgi:Tol biopolymer transport system component